MLGLKKSTREDRGLALNRGKLIVDRGCVDPPLASLAGRAVHQRHHPYAIEDAWPLVAERGQRRDLA